ncbi:hypothetical protein N1937_29485 (plasmid) [Rhizobium sp. WSM4643]|uniref:hypothetical protein n=1 Tax=Rhizobium sp. WSM4643 TaxID=3138253 RepID=UPI0021A60452|nr:hypothetical protein [Rhizobium leguminosarum]UWM78902.1 hypothetical protein N1937_29485 [Rhizobium leguminosarum bv. viciae]
MSGGSSSDTAEEEPAFFRYLVLTCVIAVNDVAGTDLDTHNFRVRMGQAFGIAELTSVGGVNRLWRRLANWSDRQRSAGRPVRQVVLPDPGAMRLIGYAVKMAFPAWRDKAQFAAILKTISQSVRGSPRRLVEELLRTHRRFDIPSAIMDALLDFSERLSSGQTMLAGHRFWALVSGIERQISAENGERGDAAAWIELRFAGFDQDVAEFSLKTARQSRLSSIGGGHFAGGAWSDVLQAVAGNKSGHVARRIGEGYAVFVRRAGSWVCDEGGPGTDDFCMVVARRGSAPRDWRLRTTWTEVDRDWDISGRIDGIEVLRHLSRNGFVPEELVGPRLTGGVSLKRNVYLGRPSFLPEVSGVHSSAISVTRLREGPGELRVEPNGLLRCEETTDGVWRIGLAEGDNRMDLTCVLEGSAPEPSTYSDFTSKSGWRQDREMSDEAPSHPLQIGAMIEDDVAADRTAMDDLGEAIFSKAGTGWREGELIALIERVVPTHDLVWDVLRAYQEAGWLDPYVSQTWRGRVWTCRRPSLVLLSESEAVVDGATPCIVQKALSKALGVTGGELKRYGGAPWSPESIRIDGMFVARLAETLEWPVLPLSALPAPDPIRQWIEDPRTPDGRRHASSWSYGLGLFVDRHDESARVSLERWVRDRGDEADLYVLRRGSEILKKTASRVAAILEGHRLNKIALFAQNGERLRRIGKSGYLPSPIARQARFRTMRSSGPVMASDGTWDYAYHLDRSMTVWLRRFIGEGFAGPGEDGPATGSAMALARRRGTRRPSWDSIAGGV